MFFDGFQPLPDVRGEAGVYESDVPIINIATQKLDILSTPGEDEIVGDAFVIGTEVIFDDVRLITQTKDEVSVPIMGIIFHHMPEDWPIPDWHHRFGQGLRIFAHPHAHAATKEHYFHIFRVA